MITLPTSNCYLCNRTWFLRPILDLQNLKDKNIEYKSVNPNMESEFVPHPPPIRVLLRRFPVSSKRKEVQKEVLLRRVLLRRFPVSSKRKEFQKEVLLRRFENAVTSIDKSGHIDPKNATVAVLLQNIRSLTTRYVAIVNDIRASMLKEADLKKEAANIEAFR
ncbi:hypothetical protein Tco_0432621 [Tanacetum coccineum]